MTGKAPGTMIQDNTVTAAQIGPGAVGTDELADGAVTGPKMAAGLSMPAGSMAMFAGSTAPTGWLLCQGQAVSRTANAALFAAIGTTWGAGDGSTTFNVPDLRGRAPIGAGTGCYLADAGAGQTEPLRDQRVGDTCPHGGEQASVAFVVLDALLVRERDHRVRLSACAAGG
jgi:long-subunit fatty acid transport protein